LAEEQQAEVEMRLLTDREYFNELPFVEDEITDDFLFGVLPDHEHKRTRDFFLAAPERRQKLKFAKALEQYASASPPEITAETANENALAEAQRNRVLLGSLISGDWMGLRLLVLLKETPRSEGDLASKVPATPDWSIARILTRLLLSDVVQEDGGLFSCTEMGMETLQRIEETSGVRLTA
jgi:hypothetical protein